jgi:hypothetical protein
MGRVRIGTCTGPADAALVRAAFEAHDIPIVINAEHHASMLGGIGGVFVPLHVYVDEQDAEQAAALLKDLREREPLEEGAEEVREGASAEGEAGAGEDDAGAAGDGEDVDREDEDDDDEAGVPIEVRIARRRRAVAVVLLGFCVTFGTAHMLTGAWLRGVAIAMLEAIAIGNVMGGKTSLGAVMLVGCIAADVIGALVRVYTGKPQIPVARVRR